MTAFVLVRMGICSTCILCSFGLIFLPISYLFPLHFVGLLHEEVFQWPDPELGVHTGPLNASLIGPSLCAVRAVSKVSRKLAMRPLLCWWKVGGHMLRTQWPLKIGGLNKILKQSLGI